ncbi:hypothetical protein [Aeromonas aquatica]|uniref:hypothetical protein n=1 Tax=Aeromonas aquatica TaxID=558964 RepID=UPI00051B755B|nr:hypothetical protein [Aeromonas aquatica]
MVKGQKRDIKDKAPHDGVRRLEACFGPAVVMGDNCDRTHKPSVRATFAGAALEFIYTTPSAGVTFIVSRDVMDFIPMEKLRPRGFVDGLAIREGDSEQMRVFKVPPRAVAEYLEVIVSGVEDGRKPRPRTHPDMIPPRVLDDPNLFFPEHVHIKHLDDFPPFAVAGPVTVVSFGHGNPDVVFSQEGTFTAAPWAGKYSNLSGVAMGTKEGKSLVPEIPGSSVWVRGDMDAEPRRFDGIHYQYWPYAHSLLTSYIVLLDLEHRPSEMAEARFKARAKEKKN